jgi:predicted dithiol-disulfide oxidoreductase (DUF899 family)
VAAAGRCQQPGNRFAYQSAQKGNQPCHISTTRHQPTSHLRPRRPALAAQTSGEIFHTYSTYSRGLDPINSGYQLLDLTPKGRDEQDLPWTMAWGAPARRLLIA